MRRQQQPEWHKEWRVDQWALSPEDDDEDDARACLLGAPSAQHSVRELCCGRPVGAQAGKGGGGELQRTPGGVGGVMPELMCSSMAEPPGGRRHQQRVANIRARVDDTTSPWVIHPLRWQVLLWNFWMLILVVASVFVLPFQAAFVEEPSATLTAMNLASDCMCVIDTALQFFLAILDPHTHALVFNHQKVIHAYVQGAHFPSDIISSLPVSLLLRSAAPMSAPAVLVRGSEFLKICRLSRVPRLLLMLRFKRSLSYGAKTLINSASMVFVVAHTMACAWGLIGIYGGSDARGRTWIDTATSAGHATSYQGLGSGELYVACLYWAVFTLTGIGYGDIVPQNHVERIVGVSGMLIGALTWAVVVANIISIVGIWSAADAAHEVRMDELEDIMEEWHFHGGLRMELRGYFKKRSLHLEKFGRLRDTIACMSPSLAAQAVEALYGEHFNRVYWLRNLLVEPSKLHGPFLVELAENLECQLYCPAELVTVRQALVFLLHGTAILRGEGVVIGGSVWGEDMLLDNPKLRRSASAMALTFVEVAFLERANLDEALENFPLAKRHIRRQKSRLALMRGILIQASAERAKQEAEKASASPEAAAPARSSQRDKMMNALKFKSQTSRLELAQLSGSAWDHSGSGKARSQPFHRQVSQSSLPGHGHGHGHHLESRMGRLEEQLSSVVRAMDRLTTKVDVVGTTMQSSLLSSQQSGSDGVELVNQEGMDPELSSIWENEKPLAEEEPGCGSVSPRTLRAFANPVPSRCRLVGQSEGGSTNSQGVSGRN